MPSNYRKPNHRIVSGLALTILAGAPLTACQEFDPAIDVDDAIDPDVQDPADEPADPAPGLAPASDELLDPAVQAVGVVSTVHRSTKLDTTTGVLDGSN